MTYATLDINIALKTPHKEQGGGRRDGKRH
jgi:hypothetical protein